MLVPVVVVVALVVIGAVVWIERRRSSNTGPVVETPLLPNRRVDAPMTSLESALNQVTDRSGRPIGDRIDAEAGHVDEFRVPDDTGPLLRRALDHVAPGTGTGAESVVAEPTGATAADGSPIDPGVKQPPA